MLEAEPGPGYSGVHGAHLPSRPPGVPQQLREQDHQARDRLHPGS